MTLMPLLAAGCIIANACRRRRQALLFKKTSMGFVAQLHVFFAHTKRIAD
jgi:hypothetical protein